MIVNVRTINMGGDYERMIAFCEAHRQLLPKPVGVGGIDLTRLKALPNMIGQHITATLVAPGDVFILPFAEQELRIRRVLSRVFSYKRKKSCRGL